MRLAWLILALIHIAPLIGTTSRVLSADFSASAIANCVAVWLAFAFFGLKFADVAWLRCRVNRVNVLTFLLICALAHREVRSTVDGTIARELPTAIGMSVAGTLLLRSRRALPRALEWLGLALGPCRGLIAGLRRWCEIAAAQAKVAEQHAFPGVPRAPPIELC